MWSLSVLLKVKNKPSSKKNTWNKVREKLKKSLLTVYCIPQYTVYQQCTAYIVNFFSIVEDWTHNLVHTRQAFMTLSYPWLKLFFKLWSGKTTTNHQMFTSAKVMRERVSVWMDYLARKKYFMVNSDLFHLYYHSLKRNFCPFIGFIFFFVGANLVYDIYAEQHFDHSFEIMIYSILAIAVL